MSRLHQMQSGKLSLTVAAGLLIVFLFCGSSALAASQQLNAGFPPGNNDNPHNLSSTGLSSIKGDTDQICIFCHTPHNASSRGPLWNRPDITSPLGGGNFPLYARLSELRIDDADLVAVTGYAEGSAYPNGATRLCLSCHDGVTAVGAVISSWEGPIADSIGPMTTMTIDLSTSHPVSFVYNSTVEAQLDIKPGVTPGQYKLPSAGILDSDSRMQCTACHDPHTDTNDGSYHLPMWKKYTGFEGADYDNTCGECHIGDSASTGLWRPSPGGIHPIP